MKNEIPGHKADLCRLTDAKSNTTDTLGKARQNKFRKYPGSDDARSRDGMIFPSVSPSFVIPRGAKVFTIGSCFARNVEEVLVSRGMDVPAVHFDASKDRIAGRPNRALNQYTPANMLQILECLDKGFPEGGLYENGEGMILDGMLSTGGTAVTLSRAIERRREIADLYTSGLPGANVVILTLGLIECWADIESGLYLNQGPFHKLLNSSPERFRFCQLTLDECLVQTRGIVEKLIGNGCSNIILTVSPVPFAASFGPGDAVASNTYSKSVLRVAADIVCSEYDGVDYFPSYEIVSSAGLRSFDGDQRHVRNSVVEQVMDYMIRSYVR